MPGIGLVDFQVIGAGIIFLWIFGLTNAFNFMDGTDGLVGGQAIIAAFGWFLALTGEAAITTQILAVLLGGTALGFLIYNWPPARVFMGDTGGTFLGLSFGGIGLMADSGDPKMPILAGFIVLPIVLDSFLTFLRRATSGENVLKSHETHLYQRLLLSGLGPIQVILIYYGLALLSVSTILLWYWKVLEFSWLILLAATICTVLFWRFVIGRERR